MVAIFYLERCLPALRFDFLDVFSSMIADALGVTSLIVDLYGFGGLFLNYSSTLARIRGFKMKFVRAC